MVQPVVPKQDLPIFPSKKVFGWLHIGHFLHHTSSKLVGIGYGLLFKVRRSYPASRISYFTKTRIFKCLPRGPPWCAHLGWQIWMDLTLSGILQCLLGICDPWNPPSWARKFMIGHQNRFSRLVPRYVLCLEVRFPRWALRKEGLSGIHGGHLPCRWISTGKLTEVSWSSCCPSSCPKSMWLWRRGASGPTRTSAAPYGLMGRCGPSPITCKFLQTCCRIWLVSISTDLYTYMRDSMYDREGWYFGISCCSTKWWLICPSPW